MFECMFSRVVSYIYKHEDIFHKDGGVTLLEWSEMDTLIDLLIPFQHSQNGFIID